MLADHPIHTTLPASDLARAKRFYAEKLGLTLESETPGGVFYRCGGTSLFVYPSGGKASGTHTQLGWTVDDIEAEVADLKARGVVFEEYNSPDLKTINSVATTGPIKAAWFKDSEGNLLGLAQFL
jgi:catechol 2,3-dioxygenase-like lactoylglutathione lyase family enzyme